MMAYTFACTNCGKRYKSEKSSDACTGCSTTNRNNGYFSTTSGNMDVRFD